MPSLRRRRDKKVCDSKVKHPTKAAAHAAASSLMKQRGIRARVYQCPGRHGEPRHFHLTTKP